MRDVPRRERGGVNRPVAASGGKTAPRVRGARGRRVAAALAWASVVPLLCLAAALAPCGRASGGTVIAVTPTRIPLRIAPGEAGSGEVELINQGDAAVRLLPVVAVVREEEGGGASLALDERCSWVVPGREEITLPPGEREPCPFAVRVPVDAASGEYRFALSFEQAAGDGGGVGFTGGVAVLLELEVIPAGDGGGGSVAGPVAGAAAACALAMGAILFLVTRRHGKQGAERKCGEGRT